MILRLCRSTRIVTLFLYTTRWRSAGPPGCRPDPALFRPRPGLDRPARRRTGPALAQRLLPHHRAGRLTMLHRLSILPLLVQMYRSEEHTSELQSLMRISYAVFCLKKKKTKHSTLLTTLTTSN